MHSLLRPDECSRQVWFFSIRINSAIGSSASIQIKRKWICLLSVHFGDHRVANSELRTSDRCVTFSEWLKSSFGHQSHQTLLASSVAGPWPVCVRLKCCILVCPSFACSYVRTPIETCWWPFRSKCHLNSLKPVKGFWHQSSSNNERRSQQKMGTEFGGVCAQVHTEPNGDKKTQSISVSPVSCHYFFCLDDDSIRMQNVYKLTHWTNQFDSTFFSLDFSLHVSRSMHSSVLLVVTRRSMLTLDGVPDVPVPGLIHCAFVQSMLHSTSSPRGPNQK